MKAEDLIKRFGAHRLDRALSFFAHSDNWTDIDRIASIPLKLVLWEVWKPARLERCRERLAAGERAPPVHVSGYRIAKVTFWSLGDGNHRSAAAAEAGRTRIRAKIAGRYDIDPTAFVIRDGHLWRPSERDDWMTTVASLPDDVEEVLIELGSKRNC